MVDAWFYDDHPGGSLQRFAKVLRWKYPITKALLHSTETSGYPGYGGDGSTAPHATIDPWNKTFRQHYSLDLAAWALRAPAGVSTNTAGVVQFEIIGTCDPRSPHAKTKYLPGAPDDVLAYIASVVKMVTDRLGIPWRSSVTWVAYPASYGLTAPQRLNAGEWYGYQGILGHEHAPGNSHGDVGAFPIDRFLALGNPGPAPAPPQPEPEPLPTVYEEDDMPRLFRMDNTNLAWEDLGDTRRRVTRPQYDYLNSERARLVPPQPGVGIAALPVTDAFWRKPVSGDPYGEGYRRGESPEVWVSDTATDEDGVTVHARRWVDFPTYVRQGSFSHIPLAVDDLFWSLPTVGALPPVKES